MLSHRTLKHSKYSKIVSNDIKIFCGSHKINQNIENLVIIKHWPHLNVYGNYHFSELLNQNKLVNNWQDKIARKVQKT